MKLLSHSIKQLSQILLCSVVATILALNLAYAGEEHGHDDKKNEEVVTMSDAMALANGIVTQGVQEGVLNQTTRLYGKITPDPAALSHIRARFDGVIGNVSVNIGDSVKKGDALASVESNESLKRYAITAPFNGLVIARHANAGELSNGQVLFSIANYQRVWAQLALFPSQITAVRAKQTAVLSHSTAKQDTRINHITASAEDMAHSVVYVSVDNSDGKWPVGTLVSADVTTAKVDVSLAVPLSALQEYEGKTVVFVKKGDTFYPTPIKTGEADNTNIEVLSGLSSGDLVVTQNSFLLKADLEKSEAGHDH